MNEHSEKFYLVKGYYDSGEWKKKAVKNAVKKNWITAAEYEEIARLSDPELVELMQRILEEIEIRMMQKD